MTASYFYMHDSDVSVVAKTLGFSINKYVYKAIDLAVYMKEDGDLFTPKSSKTRCDCIKDVVVLVCK